MAISNILALVLGGGRGTRLYPLTKHRSKPAVPLAGKYRLIDVPISNCINSQVNRIYVLTQFNSVSLHRHIRRAYTFDIFSGGFVEILAAQQTLDSSGWYQGTADAVRQNMRYLQQADIHHVLILSGDQLYRMNYADMLATHAKSGADVTIAAMPVTREAASGFGIMRSDDTGRVVGFLEKPKTAAEMDSMRTDPAWIDARGVVSGGRDQLASLGIYLFNRETLIDVLTKTDYHDFGREIFPASIRSRKVQMHLFDGYWEDIGTIKSFYQCNLDLAASQPPFDLVSAEAPIYTRARYLPPSHIRRRDDPQQSDFRRLHDRRRSRDREQRRRIAVPNWARRGGSEHGNHGGRRVRLPVANGPGSADDSAGDRRRSTSGRGDHRQELPDRPQRADRE